MPLQEELDAATRVALAKIFDKWSLNRLQQCFPSISRTNEAALFEAHEHIKHYIESSFTKDFKALCNEKQLTDKLCVFDEQRAACPDFSFNPATEENTVFDEEAELAWFMSKIAASEEDDLENAIAEEQQKTQELLQQLQEITQQVAQEEQELKTVGMDEAAAIMM